jgi:hypothetical protein
MGSVGRVRGSNFEMPMSAMGQKQTLQGVRVMSAIPPKAGMDQQGGDVRFVPKADIPNVLTATRANHRATTTSL